MSLELAFVFLLIGFAYGQEVITVNETTPCFLNYTAGVEIWDNCGFDEDYLSAAILPFEYITGGYFSMIIVSVLLGAIYITYKEAIYPIMIGIVFLPISFFLFPETFIVWSVIMAFLGLGILVWYVYVKQTKEF